MTKCRIRDFGPPTYVFAVALMNGGPFNGPRLGNIFLNPFGIFPICVLKGERIGMFKPFPIGITAGATVALILAPKNKLRGPIKIPR